MKELVEFELESDQFQQLQRMSAATGEDMDSLVDRAVRLLLDTAL